MSNNIDSIDSKNFNDLNEKIINFKCLSINKNIRLDLRKKKKIQISFNKRKKKLELIEEIETVEKININTSEYSI